MRFTRRTAWDCCKWKPHWRCIGDRHRYPTKTTKGAAMISCDRCPFAFPGDIVCLNCPTGYRINFDAGHHPGVGQTFSVTLVFHMTSERIAGKIRCNTFTDERETSLSVTVVSAKEEFNGRVFDTIRYQMSGATCVRCHEDKLRFYLERPDRCPHCQAIGLRKSVTFGPILKPPRVSG